MRLSTFCGLHRDTEQDLSIGPPSDSSQTLLDSPFKKKRNTVQCLYYADITNVTDVILGKAYSTSSINRASIIAVGEGPPMVSKSFSFFMKFCPKLV
jgi:hypothetical protein